MSIKVNYNNMMQDILGEKGISHQQLTALIPFAQDAHAKVESKRGQGMQGWMDSPYTFGVKIYLSKM